MPTGYTYGHVYALFLLVSDKTPSFHLQGCAVIRMMNFFLGDKTFTNGLTVSFLNKQQVSSKVPFLERSGVMHETLCCRIRALYFLSAHCLSLKARNVDYGNT